MGLVYFFVGVLALLFIGGAIWAIVSGAPVVGFIILCVVIGAIVVWLGGSSLVVDSESICFCLT